jgi:AIG2-like family
MNKLIQAEKVLVFFYGSFINRKVLARVDYSPEKWEIARLDGFDISLHPLATLEVSDRDCVYGVLATATHAELGRLYGEEWVRAYRPRAVIVVTSEGVLHAALCYIANSTTGKAPFRNYLDHIVGPARKLGFPLWYVERLERLKHE